MTILKYKQYKFPYISIQVIKKTEKKKKSGKTKQKTSKYLWKRSQPGLTAFFDVIIVYEPKECKL